MSRTSRHRPPVPVELSILIAEDIGSSRQLLASLLRQITPVLIHELADGAAVVDAHRRLRPDVMFLDIGLPNKSGLEALREIRQLDPDAFVVIVSANGDADTVTEAVAIGVDGFVVKPYSPRRIASALDRYMARIAV